MNTPRLLQPLARFSLGSGGRRRRIVLPLVLLSLTMCGGNEDFEDVEDDPPSACDGLESCVASSTLQDGTRDNEVKGGFTIGSSNTVTMQVEETDISDLVAIPVEPGKDALISIPARSNSLIDSEATDQNWGWCAIDGGGNTFGKHHPFDQADQGTTLTLPGPDDEDDDAIFYAVRMYGETQSDMNTTLFVGDDPTVVVRALSGNNISPTTNSRQPDAVECCSNESMDSWSADCPDSCDEGENCGCDDGIVACM